MSYLAPDLLLPVVLQGGYVAPDLAQPVVLGDGDAVVQDGNGWVLLPAPLPPLAAAGMGQAVQPGAGLATLPAPALTLHASGAGDQVQSGAGLVLLPPPLPPFIGVGRERAYEGNGLVSLPAPLPLLSGHGIGGMVQPVGGLVVLPAPLPSLIASASGDQLIDMPGGDGTRATSQQQQAEPAQLGRAMPLQQMQPARQGVLVDQHAAAPRHGVTRAPQAASLPAQTDTRAPQAQALPRWTGMQPRHAQMRSTRTRYQLSHAHGLPRDGCASAGHADTLTAGRLLASTQQQALPADLWLLVGQRRAECMPVRLHLRWQHGQAPLPGRWWPTYAPPGLFGVVLQAGYVPRPLHCPVLLGVGYPVQPPCVLPPREPIRIPQQEVYYVANSFSLVLAATGQPLHALDFSASLDVDSWCWGWSARIPASQLDLVRAELGDAVELIATVNGTPLRLVVERLARDRQFANATLRISGRGRAAWLAEPFAPVQSRRNDETRTAQQLLVDALTYNSVPIGWGVDWQLSDWLVPAGAWSHTGSYIEAALRIAEAGGGYVQAHDTAQTLRILPRYPALPWAWAEQIPDIALPEDVVTVEGIEWQDKAPYNAVYVAGGESGRLDRIRRAGTAGELTAPTIVDPLATAPEMTRARGGVVLADSGRQAQITLKLPVMSPVGVIRPGQLVQYTEQGQTHLGLSRAVSLDVGLPEIWQTVRIETHEQSL